MRLNWSINLEKQIKIVLISICFFYQLNSFGQVIVKGDLYDENNLTLQQVSVILKDSISQNIIDYTYTNEKGSFEFEVSKTGLFNLEFRYLGHESKTVPIETITSQKEIKVDVILKEKSIYMDEVIIHTERPISVKKDTINFKVKYFTDGTEETVEVLLKKIPGLQIDSEGTIKVGNQEIEKLMVEGDDLFERGYKILSKNMPAHPIEEVEIYNNYSDNRLLKGIEESNKVALNLKLNEKSKNIWFGNLKTSIGNDRFYEFRGNLMNFGKKNKYYFLTNLNNIGYDATGDIENLVKPFRTNGTAGTGDNQQVIKLLDLSVSVLNFEKSRTNFNHAKLFSLNAILNPSEKLKIKPLVFLNWDETDFFRKNIDVVDIGSTKFTNTEDYKHRNKSRIAFGKSDVTYNISKTQILESTTKYNNGDFNDGSSLVFNGNSTIESLQYRNKLFDQKISYNNKFKDNKVLLFTGRFIAEKTPQYYSINQFFYQDLFPDYSNTNNVKQQSTDQMQFMGFNAHLMDRKQNDDLLELQLGNEYRKDKLSTTFSLLDGETILAKPGGFQNQTIYRVNDLYFISKYRYKINDFALVVKLNLHQFFNRLENNLFSEDQNPFFINPGLGLEWKINDMNKITSSYSFNTTNASVLEIYSDFVLSGFRSFSKGTGSFNQLDASSIFINHQLGNWTNRFFANTLMLYNKNHDFFSTNTVIKQNFTQSEKILIKNREFLIINTKLDYYLKFISSNLKLDLGYSKSEFKNIVNYSDLRQVTSKNYTYGIELRSGFKGICNYHLGTKWSTSRIETSTRNSFTDNVSFFDLSFVFNDKFDVQIQSEQYFFGNLETDQPYYFLDFDARYKLVKNKLTLGITGNNLFNTERFRSFSISDIGSTTTEFRLLQRFILFKIEYRF